MNEKPKKSHHPCIRATLLALQSLSILAFFWIFVAVANAGAATLELTQGEQDGYTSDHEYNVTDIVLVCGQRGFVAVMEFPVPRGTKVDSATLVMQVVKVDKPGEVALYHLLNFNNGYAETQDFYASAEKVGQIEVQKPGEISFPVGKYLKKDAQGPGGFSSYRLESLGAQIMLSAFESGKDKAKINVQ